MGIIQNRIYLCSQSPRCRELLKQIGINFEMLLLRCDPRRGVDVNEAPLDDEPAEHYVLRICQEKARAGSESLRMRSLPPFPVLAADTIVVLDGKIFGKP
ncbi:MAG: septum formation inhibitor Maf, partial [Betaproteobacteria bacterium HGW-Betaproteobacteria-18]